jgi:hypothetical protein
MEVVIKAFFKLFSSKGVVKMGLAILWTWIIIGHFNFLDIDLGGLL